MAFNSIVFLYLFLPITLVIYYLLPDKVSNTKVKSIVLIVLSLIFYSWGDIKYLPLLLLATILNYLALEGWTWFRMTRGESLTAKILFALIVVLNVALLASGKYFLKTMPLAISFYTFKMLSAVFDIRKSLIESEAERLENQGLVLERKDAELDTIYPTYIWSSFKKDIKLNFTNFLLYISFFPELIIGPISRFKNFVPSIDKAKKSWNNLYQGLLRFLPALFVKVLIVDEIGALRTDLLHGLGDNLGVLEAWLVAIFYMIYIYLDFASYSAMAVGLSRTLGFDSPENFNNPYSAVSITDFWRRWHMSLSSWFRDYVYIPLGGNRKGLARQLLNITVVWALTGIWHGNQLNFLLWGLFYAVILIMEKMFLLKVMDRLPKFVRRIITLFIVNMGWVLFAFPNTKELFSMLGSMFGANGWSNGEGIYALTANIFLILIALLATSELFTKFLKNLRENESWNKPYVLVIRHIFTLILLIISTAYILDQSFASFLYFQF